MAYLSREATLLYFTVCSVADKHGISFYGDATLAVIPPVLLPVLLSTRDELLARNPIAHEMRFTQVLPWLLPLKRFSPEPDAALIQLSDILRQAVVLCYPDGGRNAPWK
jgi:hypothetical protein